MWLRKALTLTLVVTGMAAGVGLAGSAFWQAVAGGDVSSSPVTTPLQDLQAPGDAATSRPTTPPDEDSEASGGVPPTATTPPSEPSASGSLAPTGSPSASSSVTATVEQDVLARLNTERKSENLPVLVVDAELNRHAADWAEQMAKTGYAHSPSSRLAEIINQTGAGAIGENIHAPEPQCDESPCTDPSRVPTSGVLHVDWMRSSVHRDAMLEQRWDRVGAGVFCDAKGRMWAVVLFASPSGVPVKPPAATSPRTPHVAENDGVTCKGTYRGPDPSWVHPQPS